MGPSRSPSPVALLLQLPKPFLTSLRHKAAGHSSALSPTVAPTARATPQPTAQQLKPSIGETFSLTCTHSGASQSRLPASAPSLGLPFFGLQI